MTLNAADGQRGAPSVEPDVDGADVVDTWRGAIRDGVTPLVVREGLRTALGLADLPTVTRIDAGHSNPTFLVATETARMILRRPPHPPYAPGAHDVLREYRILTALRDQDVRTPVAVLACSDPAVIGAPFYLMEALDGLILRDAVPAPLDTPVEREHAGAQMVEALVELHRVDPAAAGLGDPARGHGYLRRQVDLWAAQWEQNQTRPIRAVDEVTRRLRDGLPRSPRISIVHGDYKLDNVMFARDRPARVCAILDWEMATLGDPLADLGYLTATWIDADEAPDRIGGLSTATMEPGFPDRRRLTAAYAEASGLPLEHLQWYQALALWKLAILLEASYRRFLAGTAQDAFFATLEEGVRGIAEQALDATEGALV